MVWRDQPRQLEFANRFGLLLLLRPPLLHPRLHHSPEKKKNIFYFNIFLFVCNPGGPNNHDGNGQRQQPGRIQLRHNKSRTAGWRENPNKEKNTIKSI